MASLGLVGTRTLLLPSQLVRQIQIVADAQGSQRKDSHVRFSPNSASSWFFFSEKVASRFPYVTSGDQGVPGAWL